MAKEARHLCDKLPCLALGEESTFGEGGEGRQNLDDDELLGVCEMRSRGQQCTTQQGVRKDSPAKLSVMSGKMYSSKLFAPTHPATSTAFSFHAARNNQSRVLRYVTR